MDDSEKIMKLIDYGDYFTINRPCQYGKTTLLSFTEEILKNSGDYFPMFLTFENIDENLNIGETTLAKSFIDKISQNLVKTYPNLQLPLEEIAIQTTSTLVLSNSTVPYYF